jgi:hypothetical protein
MTMRDLPAPTISRAPRLDELLAGTARGLVDAQGALDEAARDSIVRWEEDGLPPTALAFVRCAVEVPVRWGTDARASQGSATRLALLPHETGAVRGTLRVAIRFLPTPQDEAPEAPTHG